jgi:two-component system, OmpR family, heavy metal sensor histidine kinase CusS
MSNTPHIEPPIHDQATAGSREQARAATAAIRLAAGVGFLGVGAAWTLTTRKVDLVFLVLPMLAYVALAAMAFFFRRHKMVRHLAFVMPFLDVGLAFLVHQHALATFPQFAASWALSSLGIYTLIIVLVGLSLPIRMVVVLTLLSALAEWALLRTPGITFWALLVATFALALVAVATSAVPRNAEAALRQESQAAVTRNSLALAQEQNRQLDLVQHEKDALLEIIIHDMRNPIGAAMLSLEYLASEIKRHPSQASMLEATTDALATLNSLNAMISQILDTSKLESGRITLHLDFMELRPVIEGAMRNLAPRASSRHIAASLEAPEHLIAALDPRLFPRALDALATHVLRHTPEGGRMLLVATEGDDEVRVSLHATAPAIPAAERARIFDKFPFAGQETHRLSGWGLGLHFCRLVVSAHQGNIEIIDVDGWTTSFVIRLPAQRKSR